MDCDDDFEPQFVLDSFSNTQPLPSKCHNCLFQPFHIENGFYLHCLGCNKHFHSICYYYHLTHDDNDSKETCYEIEPQIYKDPSKVLLSGRCKRQDCQSELIGCHLIYCSKCNSYLCDSCIESDCIPPISDNCDIFGLCNINSFNSHDIQNLIYTPFGPQHPDTCQCISVCNQDLDTILFTFVERSDFDSFSSNTNTNTNTNTNLDDDMCIFTTTNI